MNSLGVMVAGLPWQPGVLAENGISCSITEENFVDWKMFCILKMEGFWLKMVGKIAKSYRHRSYGSFSLSLFLCTICILHHVHVFTQFVGCWLVLTNTWLFWSSVGVVCKKPVIVTVLTPMIVTWSCSSGMDRHN